MSEIEFCEEPRWLLAPSPPVLAYFSGVFFNRSVAAPLVLRISQIEFAEM